MKLPKDFPELDDLLKQMGVPFQPFVDPEIEESITVRGITVTSDDVKVAPNRTLEYQGRKVVLYIRDARGSLPKYHVVDCRTLKRMRGDGRYERYVVTRRTDGEFLLNFADNVTLDDPETHRLDICKNCLWHELNRRDLSPDAFPLEAWFNAIDPSYEPPPIDGLYGPITTPTPDSVSKYPPDWNLRSLQCRERAEWKCEECGIDVKNQPEISSCSPFKRHPAQPPGRSARSLYWLPCRTIRPRPHEKLAGLSRIHEVIWAYLETIYRQVT